MALNASAVNDLNHNAAVTPVPAISQAFLNDFKLAIDVYVVATLCFFGITGNILSIIVLGKDKTMRGTTGFLLQMLAIADTLYLIMCLFIQTINAVEELTAWYSTLNFYWSHAEQYVWPIASFAQTCTVWTVVIVTADRWLAITRPLHAPRYCTLSRMRWVVAGIWLIAAGYNVPLFFERFVGKQYDSQMAGYHVNSSSWNTTTEVVATVLSTKWVVKRTPMRDDNLYVIVYTTTLFFLLRFLLPLAGLAYFNTRLIQAIRKSRALRAQRGEAESRRDRITLTLVVVVVVFVICELPDFCLRIWMSLKKILPHLPYDLHVLRLINVISNLFLTINSCSNVIIYILLGRKFRSVLISMLCRSHANLNETLRGGNNNSGADYHSVRLKTVIAVRRDDQLHSHRTSLVREHSL